MSNVKLAIRVRPFTERELKSDKERTAVVNVIDDNLVTITNVKVSVSGAGDSRERVRRYYADHTFDSSVSPNHPNYASQEKVFDRIGREVVASVLHGSSTCVLAYGQSATGKTHTMMGSEAEPGLVPRLCRALAEAGPFELTVSFLEIYNERVHDLLAGESAPACHSLPRRRGNARKDLRVREHPNRGPYVQNLRRVGITDLAGLLSLVSEGARRRRTAATRRNVTSSRSHALLEIATPTSTLHLADLAGSEKAGWEGCGGRQKEGANINKSLVALSNVISALVGGGSGRGRFVPYRDSALTWLLKDCFTGGACTFIIATVSPSVACYGESASTLRWAARARQLPPVRPAGVGAATRLALQSQFNNLIAELTRNYIRYVPDTGKIIYEENHWKLNTNHESKQLSHVSEENANIGNIMNLLHPKTDAQSESTASSVASGSSDVINAMDKNADIDLKSEISKEVDKLFGPALERTQSNSDLKVIAPLRHKRRQYKSQEILPIVEKMQEDQLQSAHVLPSHSEAQINDITVIDKLKSTQVPILYDSQRAEIVASVTERLYNKIKKKEEAASQAAAKVETIIDKKIMEPLSELKICTNARQRLIEISQKAIRHKRRIGIPAHTQTRKLVTRVRDQGVDAQTDLETYYKNRHLFTLRRDAATETIPMTPRCKEIAVGSKYGMLYFHDRSTVTEEKKVTFKNSFSMTDFVKKCDRTTQTQIVPPPRRKRRASCCKCMQNVERNICSEEITAPIISINISQVYPADSESQTSADESDHADKPESLNMTPDLLTNHNTIDPNIDRSIESDQKESHNHPSISFLASEAIASEPGARLTLQKHSDTNDKMDVPSSNNDLVTVAETQNIPQPATQHHDDFPDTDECALPRVTVNCVQKQAPDEMKDIILGRNENIYPYNIVLSPPRVVDYTKRIVKFKEDDTVPAFSVASQTTWEWQNINGSSAGAKYENSEPVVKNTLKENVVEPEDSHVSSYSDSTESSKAETDSFIWKSANTSNQYESCNKTNSLGRSFTPVYRGSKYAKAKAKLYREFLGLDKEEDYNECSKTSSKNSSKDISSSDSAESREISNHSFRRRKNFLEEKLKFKCSPRNSFTSLEQELMNSCHSLEASVNKYESYLANFRNSQINIQKKENPSRTPTEYLQHLVQLRRQVVKGDCDTDSSFGNMKK